MSRWFAFILVLLTFNTLAQYQYQRLNQVRTNRIAAPLFSTDTDFHTSVRPYNRWQIDSADSGVLHWPDSLAFDRKGWLGRKLFNEHLVNVSGKDYQIVIDPVVNFQGGYDLHYSGDDFLFVNTRGFNLEARIGDKVSLQTSYLENQARFPEYISTYTERQEVVPGQGYRRPFKNTGFDYGMASGELSFTPSKHFSFSLGQGRNFFGEGYRSMLLSDVAFNYPFFRIETDFWRIKYVNLWAQLYDVRDEATIDGVFSKKYLSSHYLSINLTERWNWSFFEAIVVGDTNQQRSVDISFFNPVIFYRPVEFAVGSRTGNAMLGTGTSYKFRDGLQAYGQFALDEFNLEAFTEQNGSWLNKYSWQLGVKYYDAFDIDGLFARLEYNAARPFTYAHRYPLTNYGHYNQPLAHPWGANFHEGLLHLLYQWGRWEADLRYHYGLIGLNSDNTNYGADIYESYFNRLGDTGNEVAQGEQGELHYLMIRFAWLVNPASGLKLETGMRFRSLTADAAQTRPLPGGESQYFFVGLRTEFFNRYYDF